MIVPCRVGAGEPLALVARLALAQLGGRMLNPVLCVIEGHLIQGSGAGAHARFGAVSFIHRFGASLDRHVHYDENHPGFRATRALAGAQIRSRRIGPCCVIDGVFESVEDADDGPQSVRFRAPAELTPEVVAAITEQVRIRVLRWFACGGPIDHLAAQLALRLAAAQAAPPSLRARAQRAAACGCHRFRA